MYAVLTDKQILDLADEMTDRTQLRHLAINLGMPYEESVVDERGIGEEAYRMLRSWLKSQPDRNTAHRNLVHVLTYANMLEIIHLILPTKSNFPRLRRMTSGTLINS